MHVWVLGPPKISTAAGSGYVTWYFFVIHKIDLYLHCYDSNRFKNGSFSERIAVPTPGVTGKDLRARIVVASADIASTWNLFVRVRQSFFPRCRLGYDLRDYVHFQQFL
ncbi:hypothetical protein TNCV_4548011 [Trichonephila clavipes]|nr:hypothetical protein TNCV_4548011 [Trichonephila clavipes]